MRAPTGACACSCSCTTWEMDTCCLLRWRLTWHVNAQVVNAGAHRCVCVQLKLYHLAVAAVEKCEALAELEGAASVGPAPGAGPAFKVLKQLVHNWLLDTMQTGNRRALVHTSLLQPDAYVLTDKQHWWAALTCVHVCTASGPAKPGFLQKVGRLDKVVGTPAGHSLCMLEIGQGVRLMVIINI